MGNDGGSIPKRRELVKEAARNRTAAELKETRQEQHSHQWATCPLSHRPLVQPVVSDSSGSLYNKDAVLEYLLPATESTSALSRADQEEVLKGRVKSLKDVVQVRFEIEQEDDEESKKTTEGSKKGEKWLCPITSKGLGASVKSVYLVPCGHAFSDSAVKEVSGDICLQCNEKYSPENIIPILPTLSAEIEALAARAKSLKDQGLTHSLKKASGSGKKRKKDGEASNIAKDGLTATPAATSTKLEPPSSEAALSRLKSSSTPQPELANGSTLPQQHHHHRHHHQQGGIKNPATANLTAKVLEDERERKRRRKIGENENLKGLFSSSSTGKMNDDFMSRGFSIPAGAKR
ncbi:MAG: hypothetical protein M1837_005062 [Sclerophora amabilis]|nr:MAG: hypothetical protein M1837_005062 [Sclerophora amabilis]